MRYANVFFFCQEHVCTCHINTQRSYIQLQLLCKIVHVDCEYLFFFLFLLFEIYSFIEIASLWWAKCMCFGSHQLTQETRTKTVNEATFPLINCRCQLLSISHQPKLFMSASCSGCISSPVCIHNCSSYMVQMYICRIYEMFCACIDNNKKTCCERCNTISNKLTLENLTRRIFALYMQHWNNIKLFHCCYVHRWQWR